MSVGEGFAVFTFLVGLIMMLVGLVGTILVVFDHIVRGFGLLNAFAVLFVVGALLTCTVMLVTRHLWEEP